MLLFVILAGGLVVGPVACSPTSSSSSPPPNHRRSATSYDWCDCRRGTQNVTVWPGSTANKNTTLVTVATATTLTFNAPTKSISWRCDGTTGAQTTTLDRPARVWGVRLTGGVKSGAFGACKALTGRIKWNQFQPTPPADKITSVPFSSFTEGYACLKIPALLRLSSGVLLAMAEARTPDCGDFSRTDLVVKRSADNGTTWSALRKLVNVSSDSGGGGGLCGNPIVIGNAAPVQLSADDPFHPNRILVPHMRNNYEVWVTHSDDDGRTWSPARVVPGMVETLGATGPDCKRNMSYFGLKSAASFLDWVEELGWGNKGNDPFVRWRKYMTGPWQFVGLGPPGAIQLRQSGRVVVPGYHSYIRGLAGGGGQGAGVALPISQLYNNFALGHVLYSDDGGDTWVLGSKGGLGGGADKGSMGANEDQLVQLSNGSLLLNSRSLATGSPQFRVQSVSHDAGASWSPSRLVGEVPEPFNGCQGSIVATSGGTNDNNTLSTLYLSHPNPSANHGIAPSILKLFGANVNLTGRDHMTIWKSVDGGGHYAIDRLVDPGAAGYSSLQEVPGGAGLFLLYEQSDREASSLGHLAADALIGALSVLNPDRMIFRWLPPRQYHIKIHDNMEMG